MGESKKCHVSNITVFQSAWNYVRLYCCRKKFTTKWSPGVNGFQFQWWICFGELSFPGWIRVAKLWLSQVHLSRRWPMCNVYICNAPFVGLLQIWWTWHPNKKSAWKDGRQEMIETCLTSSSPASTSDQYNSESAIWKSRFFQESFS